MPAASMDSEMTQPVQPVVSLTPPPAPVVAAPEVAYEEPEEPLYQEYQEPNYDESSVFEPLDEYEAPVVEEPTEVPSYAPEPVPPLYRPPVYESEPEDDVPFNPIARAMSGPPPIPVHAPTEGARVEAVTDSSQKITLTRVVGSGNTGRIKTRDPMAPPLDGPVLPPSRPPVVPREELDPASDEARQQQEMLQLEPVAARGRFAKTDPTIVDGEDLDVPTFLRKKK
jgi:cell division protein FtsZ